MISIRANKNQSTNLPVTCQLAWVLRMYRCTAGLPLIRAPFTDNRPTSWIVLVKSLVRLEKDHKIRRMFAKHTSLISTYYYYITVILSKYGVYVRITLLVMLQQIYHIMILYVRIWIKKHRLPIRRPIVTAPFARELSIISPHAHITSRYLIYMAIIYRR